MISPWDVRRDFDDDIGAMEPDLPPFIIMQFPVFDMDGLNPDNGENDQDDDPT